MSSLSFISASQFRMHFFVVGILSIFLNAEIVFRPTTNNERTEKKTNKKTKYIILLYRSQLIYVTASDISVWKSTVITVICWPKCKWEMHSPKERVCVREWVRENASNTILIQTEIRWKANKIFCLIIVLTNFALWSVWSVSLLNGARSMNCSVCAKVVLRWSDQKPKVTEFPFLIFAKPSVCLDHKQHNIFKQRNSINKAINFRQFFMLNLLWK